MNTDIIIDILDQEGDIVSTFSRHYTSQECATWTQKYQNQIMTYNETKVDANNVQLYDGKALVSVCYDPCSMYMHIDAGKRIKMFPDCTFKLTYVIDAQDDNQEIMKLLNDRLALGRHRYGHGVRVNDDTRQWGTAEDSWETMMMEEALDGMIYAAASILRIKRKRELSEC